MDQIFRSYYQRAWTQPIAPNPKPSVHHWTCSKQSPKCWLIWELPKNQKQNKHVFPCRKTCLSTVTSFSIPTYSDILPCAHACLVKTTSSKAFLCTNPGAGPGHGAGEGAAWPGNFGKKIWKYEIYPLVIQHSYWKWPFIVDLPMKNCDFP